ncbi:ATP-binding protein [Streptomyces sp. V4-01]|uniref:ATP-binding protein n=1 Tax=Actinacidiphila polyblastidii TaxID=3110430 RepID=A0ABU7PGZ8_9ACTN|nr:ATP-binding protein [Streptomyces sp. V4-01]
MNSEISTRTCVFVRMLPATRAAAGMARRLTLGQLAAWDVPHDSEPADAAASVVAELAANAVTHGRVAGRDFELRLTLDRDAAVIRVEVSDARAERRPATPPVPPDGDAESGRGLLLVQALTRAWGVSSRDVGKTVWAEVALPEAR